MQAVEIDTGSDSQTPLLELIADVCGLLDIEELRHGLLEALHRALPSDYISLNDVGPGPRDVIALMTPDAPVELFEAWARHAQENPLLRHYQSTQEGRAVRFSDVCTRPELHALKLYTEVYGPMGVEHQMAFTLPGPPGRVVAIALSRGERDYSDGERDFADRARPFLIQAYRNAVAYQEARGGLSGVSSAPTPLLDALVAIGLTRREAEALRLVALGRSNHHVAQALGISHRTVGKHLERGFRKLGVSDRSTASARVWELAGSSAERAAAQTAADLGNDSAGLSSVALAEARA
jgi:DNA-binding CsgD family transcriptional regulator